MAKISGDTIEAVTNATDIVSVVEQYTRLERRGSTWWGCCPFHHEKTPSFQVNPEKKLFYCFGCHKGGNLLQFVMEMEGLSFSQAIIELAKRSGISVRYENGGYEQSETEKRRDEIILLYEKVTRAFHHILLHTKEGNVALQYLKNRQVSDEMIETFQLGLAPKNRKWLHRFLTKKGYSPQFLQQSGLFSKKYPDIAFFSNRIMFPIADRHGRVIAYGGRDLSNDPKSPKYLNSSDMVQYQKKYNLFALHLALTEMRKTKAVIFCEGYMDVLAFHQAGITNAVAPLGTALTEEQLQLVRPLVDTVFFCFDSDEAGLNATFRAIEMASRQNFEIRIIQITGAKDSSELLEKYGAEGLKNSCKNAIIESDFFVQKAMTKFDVLTAEGKAKACAFLFPYLQTIQSQVKRESLVDKFASKLNVSPQAVYADFLKTAGTRNQTVKKEFDESIQPKEAPFRKNAETRAMVAVFAKPELFKIMRSSLTSDDFQDETAKKLFILMEECYRDEVQNETEIMNRLTDEKLKNSIAASIVQGEFAAQPNLIVKDSIKHIKLKKLKTVRKMQVDKLHIASVQQNETEANDIINDIADLDRQIAELERQ